MRQSEPKAGLTASQGQRLGADAYYGYNAPTRPRDSDKLLKDSLACAYNLKAQKFGIKSLNDNIRYGANAATVAANAGVPIAEAQDAMDKWFGFYANVKPWMEARGMDVETQGFVTGLWGLKRRLPAIMSKEADLADLKRQAGNSPIQGFASDFNCFLILLIMGQVKEKGLRDKIRMVNTVHDSIVFEVRKGYEEHLIRFYYEAMDSMNEWCAELFGGKEYYIDMRGDLEVGPNYGSLKGAKVDVIDHGDYSNYTYSLEDE